MFETDNKTIGQLKNLISIAENAKANYCKAAKNTSDINLGAAFTILSHERQMYSRELQELTDSFAVKPGCSDDAQKHLQQAWINMHSPAEVHDNGEIMDVLIDGEETAIKAYSILLNDCIINHHIKIILEGQLNGIRAALQIIKEYGYEAVK